LQSFLSLHPQVLVVLLALSQFLHLQSFPFLAQSQLPLSEQAQVVVAVVELLMQPWRQANALDANNELTKNIAIIDKNIFFEFIINFYFLFQPFQSLLRLNLKKLSI